MAVERVDGGHAWNQVFLDGKWYNVDLTNDRDKIVEGRPCKHFLKSNIEFTRYDKYKVRSARLENCEESVQNPEELLEECRFIQSVTPKDIAEESKSRSIASREINKIKDFLNKLLNKEYKEK